MNLHTSRTSKNILVLASVLSLVFLSACTTGSDTKSTNASSGGFTFSGLKNPWSKPDPKYSELAKGPLSGEAGKSLAPEVYKIALKAEYDALEGGKSGKSVEWQHANGQNGKVTPFTPYQVGSSNCRRYSHSITIDGIPNQSTATACRDNAGIWTPLT